MRRPLTRAGGAAAALLIALAGLLAGTGWLYVLRGLHWLDAGPRLADSLPLLQLAAGDGQPLLRVLVAWMLAGALVGVALGDIARGRRAALALGVSLIVLLVGAQASYALARNLGFSGVVFTHGPGLGPVLEAIGFAVGCSLPGALTGRDRGGARRRSLLSLITRLDDRGLRGGEHRNRGQHRGDRQPVNERQTRIRP